MFYTENGVETINLSKLDFKGNLKVQALSTVTVYKSIQTGF